MIGRHGDRLATPLPSESSAEGEAGVTAVGTNL